MIANPPGNISFETARFRVRALGPEDADEAYLALWADPGLLRRLNEPRSQWNLRRARQHIARFDRDRRFHLGVFAKATDRLVGFLTVARGREAGVGTITAGLGEAVWGDEAAPLEIEGATLDFMFRELGVRKVEARLHGRDPTAMAVFQGLGFAPEGVRRQHAEGVDGGRIDVYLFGLLKDEWAQTPKRGTPAA